MNRKISTGVGIAVIVIVAVIAVGLWAIKGQQTQPAQTAQVNSLKGQAGSNDVAQSQAGEYVQK